MFKVTLHGNIVSTNDVLEGGAGDATDQKFGVNAIISFLKEMHYISQKWYLLNISFLHKGCCFELSI